MNYKEALSYIDTRRDLKIIPGLDRIRELLKRLGSPEKDVPAIHIAGTNGKGSIMTFVENALIQTGQMVGRFVSPAIFHYLDQWRLNGENVSEEDFAEVVTEIQQAEEGINGTATVFEIETAAAFLLFKKKNCDVMLIECGMGGLGDATNVIESHVLDIIAPVSRDHMQFLGDTLAKIALQKCGIIQPQDPVVSAPQKKEVRDVIKENAGLVFFPEQGSLTIIKEEINKTKFSYKNETYEMPFAGRYQVENAITALEAMDLYNKRADRFGLKQITLDMKKKAMKSAVWKGRFTTVSKDPVIIVDGAHNEEAWERLAENLKIHFTKQKVVFIMGVLKDKEYGRMLEILTPFMERAVTITPQNPRALEGRTLAILIRDYGIRADYMGSIRQALSKAKEGLPEGMPIVVCGSLSFLGEFMQLFPNE